MKFCPKKVENLSPSPSAKESLTMRTWFWSSFLECGQNTKTCFQIECLNAYQTTRYARGTEHHRIECSRN